MVYVQILGWLLSQSSSGINSTLSFSSVLMSTSTTAQDLGGTLILFLSETEAQGVGWISFVSAIILFS